MNFGFEEPRFLALLMLIPFLAAIPLWASWTKQPATMRYAYNLLVGDQRRNWRLILRGSLPIFRFLALILIVLAVARPQIGEARQVVESEGIDIALALDISGSMASLDFDPRDRLSAAKEVIGEFIDRRENDRIGLVVFAQDAFIQSPPTIDHDVLSFLVDEIDLAPNLGLADGTALGMGIATAANLLKDSPVESKVIVLLTDGVNTAGEVDPLTAAVAAGTLDIKVHTIAVGRPGTVPVPRRTDTGSTVSLENSELDEKMLQRIAVSTGGQFFRAVDATDLQRIYVEIDALETSQIEVKTIIKYQEMAKWLLAPALLLLVLELWLRNSIFRRLP
ncbi:MAG: VWA domain-containing protein [Chloroflexi bacterium]|nr:VWA domain-containing protein [Chloroflexota bacterium]MDA1226694.1 VWA domain-containing protein [Chloroflexota bacterium]